MLMMAQTCEGEATAASDEAAKQEEEGETGPGTEEQASETMRADDAELVEVVIVSFVGEQLCSMEMARGCTTREIITAASGLDVFKDGNEVWSNVLFLDENILEDLDGRPLIGLAAGTASVTLMSVSRQHIIGARLYYWAAYPHGLKRGTLVEIVSDIDKDGCVTVREESHRDHTVKLSHLSHIPPPTANKTGYAIGEAVYYTGSTRPKITVYNGYGRTPAKACCFSKKNKYWQLREGMRGTIMNNGVLEDTLLVAFPGREESPESIFIKDLCREKPRKPGRCRLLLFQRALAAS